MTSDDFDRLFDDAFEDGGADAALSHLRAYFPVSVVERLRASSVPPPVRFSQYLKRLEAEPELE
jgi:hypothetical protein